MRVSSTAGDNTAEAAHQPLRPVSVPPFVEVYESCVDMVWRYAASHGVAASALEDLVQEVFVVVHQRLAAFEGRSSIRTWVLGIARNTVRDFLRKKRFRPVGDAAVSDDLLSGAAPGPSETLERRRALAALDEALKRMNPEQHEVFILCELEQLSSREAGEVLNVNPHTVRTRLRGARQIFKSYVARFRAREAWSRND